MEVVAEQRIALDVHVAVLPVGKVILREIGPVVRKRRDDQRWHMQAQFSPASNDDDDDDEEEHCFYHATHPLTMTSLSPP